MDKTLLFYKYLCEIITMQMQSIAEQSHDVSDETDWRLCGRHSDAGSSATAA